MKRQSFTCHGVSIESAKDFNGRFFIAYIKGASMFFRDATDVRKWLKLPKGTTTRELFDLWISELYKKKEPTQAPTTPSLGESSFDPLAHGIDQTDPNYKTRTVI